MRWSVKNYLFGKFVDLFFQGNICLTQASQKEIESQVVEGKQYFEKFLVCSQFHTQFGHLAVLTDDARVQILASSSLEKVSFI